MTLENVFRVGHCPTKLDEDVFCTPYTPVNDNERRDSPAQEEEEARSVQKAKYEYDDLEDPYVDFDL